MSDGIKLVQLEQLLIPWAANAPGRRLLQPHGPWDHKRQQAVLAVISVKGGE